MNKLELNWIGKYDKENQISPEPRLLFENKEYSYTAEEKGQMSMEDGNNVPCVKRFLTDVKKWSHCYDNLKIY